MKNWKLSSAVLFASLSLAFTPFAPQAQANLDAIQLSVQNQNLSNVVAQAVVASNSMCGTIRQVRIDVESGSTQNLALVTGDGTTLYAATGVVDDVTLPIVFRRVDSSGTAISGTIGALATLTYQTAVITNGASAWTAVTNIATTTNSPFTALSVTDPSVCGSIFLRSWANNAVSNDTTANIIYDKIEP